MNREQINQLDEKELRKIIGAHLELGVDECRWCFAIDLERIKGNEIARYNFPDMTVIHYSCPRCGGEYSLCSNGFAEPYLNSIIHKLHPELGGIIEENHLNEIIGRVLYIDDTGKNLDEE